MREARNKNKTTKSSEHEGGTQTTKTKNKNGWSAGRQGGRAFSSFYAVLDGTRIGETFDWNTAIILVS